MYCLIKYIHYKDFQSIINLKGTENLEIDNKQLLVNPDCFIGIILEYVYEQIGVIAEVRDNIDFATDKGKLLQVNNFPSETNGQQIFNDKMTYYLINYHNKELCPVLSPTSKEFEEFMSYQERRSSVLKKRSLISRSSKISSTSADSKPRRVNSSSYIFKNQ
ncbi:uncharacterized protein [Leptinotarsa decemlineata]|uniref:uncharacterized protein n=1 Tax=Leptinotarsa decemlineata TaxID=7539 RepID=UPI003D30CA5D